MRDLAKLSTIAKRAGGNIRAWNETSGANPGAIAVVVENADWKAYAAYRAKFDADPELQALRAEIGARKDPAADMLVSSMAEEVPS